MPTIDPVMAAGARGIAYATTTIFMLGWGQSACAADASAATAGSAPAPIATPNTLADPIFDYFAHWQDRVEQAQASQPH